MLQDLTLADRPNDEIAEIVVAEAARAFDMLEPALGHYAIA